MPRKVLTGQSRYTRISFVCIKMLNTTPFKYLTIELCADAIIVSAAVRRSILVGGGPKIRRRFGAALVAKSVFKDPRKNLEISFYLVIDRKLPENKYTGKLSSAVRRQIISGGGAPMNKKRRRPHIF